MYVTVIGYDVSRVLTYQTNKNLKNNVEETCPKTHNMTLMELNLISFAGVMAFLIILVCARCYYLRKEGIAQIERLIWVQRRDDAVEMLHAAREARKHEKVSTGNAVLLRTASSRKLAETPVVRQHTNCCLCVEDEDAADAAASATPAVLAHHCEIFDDLDALARTLCLACAYDYAEVVEALIDLDARVLSNVMWDGRRNGNNDNENFNSSRDRPPPRSSAPLAIAAAHGSAHALDVLLTHKSARHRRQTDRDAVRSHADAMLACAFGPKHVTLVIGRGARRVHSSNNPPVDVRAICLERLLHEQYTPEALRMLSSEERDAIFSIRWGSSPPEETTTNTITMSSAAVVPSDDEIDLVIVDEKEETAGNVDES